MDEHTIYKSQPIQRMGWTQLFFQKGLWLASTGLIPSLNPALSSIYEKTDTLNKSGLIKIVRSILRFIERAGAGQWRFKKEVIDKWISEESLERSTKYKTIKEGKYEANK